MPCGRMSIASRSRSCDFRASAIAASASARLRTISPISAEARRLLPKSFGLGLAGRPGMRVIAACFSFFAALGRIFGICAPLAFCDVLFSDKYLKKWYHLPATRLVRPGSIGSNWDSDCLIIRLIRKQPRNERRLPPRDRRRPRTREGKSSLRYGGCLTDVVIAQ